MALKIIDHGSEEYKQMIRLRDEILRRPLGLQFTPEELEKEKHNLHIAAYEDDQMLGCCMLVEEEPGTVRLRQMAVINDLQGKGIGRALMQFAENLARDRGFKKSLCMPVRMPLASTKKWAIEKEVKNSKKSPSPTMSWKKICDYFPTFSFSKCLNS